jgi:hypothetical protein
VHNVIYLSEDPSPDSLEVWISEELVDEFDASLAKAGFEFGAVEAQFVADVDPALFEAVGRAIECLSAAGGLAGVARIISLFLHRNDGKKVKLLLDDGSEIETAGLSIAEVQKLVEDLVQSPPGEPNSGTD